MIEVGDFVLSEATDTEDLIWEVTELEPGGEFNTVQLTRLAKGYGEITYVDFATNVTKILHPRRAWKIAEQRTQEIQHLLSQIAGAYDEAGKYPFPPMETLRKALPTDLEIGNVLWYPKYRRKACGYWKVIGEIIGTPHEFHSFIATDGYKYGLTGAHMEKDR